MLKFKSEELIFSAENQNSCYDRVKIKNGAKKYQM